MFNTAPGPRTGFAGQLDPATATRLGPASAEAVGRFRSPVMPQGVRIALFAELAPRPKPYAYPTLSALARRLHRARRGDALELTSERAMFRDGVRQVVRVNARDAGDRLRTLGYAAFPGASWEALKVALDGQEAAAGQDAEA